MNGRWPTNFASGLLMGGLATLLAGLLMGAVRHDSPSTLPVAILDPPGEQGVPLAATGRYQIATWNSGGGFGALVLDTATGMTRMVYSSGRGPEGKSINNLGKPFAQMR